MTGVELIAAERKRQIESEGWTKEHDKEHDPGDLAMAAVCYAAPVQVFECIERRDGGYEFIDPWPWSEWEDKREWDSFHGRPVLADELTLNGRIRNLVKAGALIAAEIDKLQNEG